MAWTSGQSKIWEKAKVPRFLASLKNNPLNNKDSADFIYDFSDYCKMSMKNLKKKNHAKSISTERFPFYPTISSLYMAVKNQNLTHGSCSAEIWYVSGWHQADLNNIPYRRAAHVLCMGKGGKRGTRNPKPR